jgi:hypothetical protein
LIRKLFHIRQSGSVAEYISDFSQLVDQLRAYEPMTDPLYYTTRFIDDLHHSIRSSILLQRPPDLDTACVLASLQEEAADTGQRKEYRRLADYSTTSMPDYKQLYKQAHPLPSPPIAEMRKGGDPVINSDQSGKLEALRAYRMAKGLCKICAEKWFKGHKCSPSVQLHVVQEIWDMLGPPNCESPADCTDTSSQLFVILSQAAGSGTEYSKTLKFWGYVAGCQILILVDSGSSHSFINVAVASKLPSVSLLTSPLNVAVANGDKLSYTAEIQNIQWSVDSYSFTSTFKILPLHCYDLILGMDWLESCSPMHVHWEQKWMSFFQGSNQVILQGVLPRLPPATVIQILCASLNVLQ